MEGHIGLSGSQFPIPGLMYSVMLTPQARDVVVAFAEYPTCRRHTGCIHGLKRRLHSSYRCDPLYTGLLPSQAVSCPAPRPILSRDIWARELHVISRFRSYRHPKSSSAACSAGSFSPSLDNISMASANHESKSFPWPECVHPSRNAFRCDDGYFPATLKYISANNSP